MTLYNKNNIYDVNVNGAYVDFLYKGTCQEAANLRNYIKYNVFSYLIHKITFYDTNKHVSNKTLEFLSLRFGQLILDNNDVNDESMGKLNVSGPLMVTANHIDGLKFVHDSPIIYLNNNESLACDLYVEKNCGKMNEKWNPVSCITFTDYDQDIYKFTFELIGIISMDDILNQL
jgi:hypothetical protein